MDQREIKAIIESLLYVWGEPLSLSDIAEVLEMKKSKISDILTEMIADFNFYRRGLQIKQINNKYQLVTRPEHYEWISKLCTPKSNKKLSNAALETLSIIAYKQPITRMEIEAIRGVKCERSIYTLLQKDLIREVGRLDKPGKPILFGTTDEFLKYFGLISIEQLPELKKSTNLDDEVKENDE